MASKKSEKWRVHAHLRREVGSASRDYLGRKACLFTQEEEGLSMARTVNNTKWFGALF